MTVNAPAAQQNLPSLTPRFLLVLVLVCALGALATGPERKQEQPAVAKWVIAQHREDAVLKWLGPLTDGAQLTPRWRVADVAITAEALRLHLQEGAQPSALWVELRLDRDPPQLAVVMPPDLPPEPAQIVQVQTAKLPLPGPFQRTQPVVRAAPLVPWAHLNLAYLTLRFFSLLVAFLAGVWLLRSLPRRLWLPYLAVTVLAAVMRAWLSPAAFLHESYHVNESLSALTGQPGFFNGYAGPALYSALVPWLKWDPSWMFAVNGIAATLTVPALGRLAAAIWRDERAGLLAGLLLALSPMHLRWGAAEDQWILATAWTVLALAAWLDAMMRPDPLTSTVALLAAVLAMQARPELMPFPALFLTFALVHRWRWLLPWLRTRPAWQGLALAGVAIWPLALLLLHRPDIPHVAVTHIDPWNSSQWFNADWTPVPLQVLSVLALGLAVMKRRWTVLLVVLVAAAWTALPLLFYATDGPFLERTQLLSTALAIAVAAGAPPLLVGALPQVAWLATFLVAMGLAVQARRPEIESVSSQQQEWQFLRDHVAKLPPFQRLVAPAGTSHDCFPIALLPAEHPPQLLSLDPLVATHQWPPPGRDLLYYQSMACWYARPSEPLDGRTMQPNCEAIRQHYVLEPVDVVALSGPVVQLPLTPTQTEFEVGFFRLTAMRTDAR